MSFMSCPVHLIIIGLQPATEACVIEITASVVLAVEFIRAIPAVPAEVTKLRMRDALFVATAIRWTVKMSSKRTDRKNA